MKISGVQNNKHHETCLCCTDERKPYRFGTTTEDYKWLLGGGSFWTKLFFSYSAQIITDCVNINCGCIRASTLCWLKFNSFVRLKRTWEFNYATQYWVNCVKTYIHKLPADLQGGAGQTRLCNMCTAWKRDYRRYKRKLYRVQSIIIIHLTCIVYLPKQPGKQSS